MSRILILLGKIRILEILVERISIVQREPRKSQRQRLTDRDRPCHCGVCVLSLRREGRELERPRPPVAILA